jgi:hypothetical protein
MIKLINQISGIITMVAAFGILGGYYAGLLSSDAFILGGAAFMSFIMISGLLSLALNWREVGKMKNVQPQDVSFANRLPPLHIHTAVQNLEGLGFVRLGESEKYNSAMGTYTEWVMKYPNGVMAVGLLDLGSGQVGAEFVTVCKNRAVIITSTPLGLELKEAMILARVNKQGLIPAYNEHILAAKAFAQKHGGVWPIHSINEYIDHEVFTRQTYMGGAEQQVYGAILRQLPIFLLGIGMVVFMVAVLIYI